MAKLADAPDEELSATDETGGPTSAGDSETSKVATDKAEEQAAEGCGAVDPDLDEAAGTKRASSHVRLAMVLGVLMVVAVGVLVGWLGFRSYQAHQAAQQRELLVQVGRQGALNLTTINWQQADADVHRILDSATGTFYDDFAKRSQPFVDVVKKAQSKSVGTITEAGLESETGDEGRVLVAVTVKNSNLGAAEQEPRHWRIRLSVRKIDGEAKISNVEFVQ